MMYFTIVFLCTGGLFLALLEDHFRLWATLGVTFGVYLLSLGAAFPLRSIDPAGQLSCAAGCLLFFISSLFLYRNNILQKLFAALLALCDFAFLSFFVPLLLGALPVSTSGGLAGVISVAVYCLFTLLMGLCLYRPLHHYSDRGVSGFLAGICLVMVLLYILCLGKLDFLFRTNIPAARLLAAALLYAALIFAFRSLYQAGRFREKVTLEEARNRMLEMESDGFGDTLAALREVRSVQKSGEYTLDTISVMLADGYHEKIPAYISIAKENAAKNPILGSYHENPYLNAVIASKAAFAAQNGIAFECNAVTGDVPLKTIELCVVIDEMLSRACQDAASFEGKRKLRFTVFPAGSSLSLEAVYSGNLMERQKFSLRGKKLSDVLSWLFDESPADSGDLRGLENTGEIISRYSGKLSVSGAPDEVILQAVLRF